MAKTKITNKLFTSDQDGDSHPGKRQTVYEKTSGGSKKRKDIYYDPRDAKIKKK